MVTLFRLKWFKRYLFLRELAKRKWSPFTRLNMSKIYLFLKFGKQAWPPSHSCWEGADEKFTDHMFADSNQWLQFPFCQMLKLQRCNRGVLRRAQNKSSIASTSSQIISIKRISHKNPVKALTEYIYTHTNTKAPSIQQCKQQGIIQHKNWNIMFVCTLHY